MNAHVETMLNIESFSWILVLSGTKLAHREFTGVDLFEAMIELRRTLEEGGAQLLCAGARPEVFPSGMSRDLSGGRKAYFTRLGEHASAADLVDIFDYAAPETVGSVDRQVAFHAKRAESLRRQ